MAKSTKKSMRKFANSGALQKTIQARRKHQQIRRKVEKKGAAKKQGTKGREGGNDDQDEGEDAEDEEDEAEGGSSKYVVSYSQKCWSFNEYRFKGMSVDDFLGGGFMGSDAEDAEVRF